MMIVGLPLFVIAAAVIGVRNAEVGMPMTRTARAGVTATPMIVVSDTPRRESATAIPRPTNTIFPTLPSVGGATGYLWWREKPTVAVMVIGDSHQQNPATVEQAESWRLRGELCLAEAGSKYANDDAVRVPFLTRGVEVTSGSCKGFRGWVALEVLRRDPPP